MTKVRLAAVIILISRTISLICMYDIELGGQKALSDLLGLILQRCVKLPVIAAH